MIRQGTYTRKVSPYRRAKRAIVRSYRQFKALPWWKKTLWIGSPIVAFLIVTPVITYVYYYNDIADQERLMNRNNTGIVMLDRENNAFFSVGRAQHRDRVPLSEISDDLEHALIAAEDKDFYKHSGFSITGILRSLYGNILAQDITGGGSTLTQQLAKNTLLTEKQTILRKYQELTISLAIEQRYSKDEILDMYLNSIFYGENAFGIQDAAQTYFNKSPKDLTLAESAMLVGVLPAPGAYSPISGNPAYAKERQTTVLSRMVRNGYITEEQKTAALAEQLAYAAPEAAGDNPAPHFTEMVLSELYKRYGEEKVIRSGYQVRTTLNMSMQNQLNQQVARHINYIERRGGSNASAVAIDPTTGEVLALVGSADYNNEQWGKVNMVTTPRQPGSSFKPIYYAKALADGIITPATIMADEPTDFGGYTPQNANRSFSGDITIRNALARSLNIPSVKVMQKIGIDASVQTARAMGIAVDEKADYGLPLALGSAEAPLLQMTNAYAAYANAGEQYPTAIIDQINNKFGDNVFKAQASGKRVISAEGAFLISSILSDNNARAPIFGSSLTVRGRTVAVKTGTTDNQRDAWTIGYTPQLAIGIWVGNNDNAVMASGGSDMAGPIWVRSMTALLSKNDQEFPRPSGVVQRSVCYSNGGLANGSGAGTYQEYFLATALPTATCGVTRPVPEETKKEEEPETTSPAIETTPSNGNGAGDTPSSGSSGTTSPSAGSGGTSTGGTGNSSTITPGTGNGGGTGGSTLPSTPVNP